MTDKIAAAFCAMIFAAVALVGLMAYGDHTVRSLAIAAAVMGCICQFTYQGSGRAQIMCVYAALAAFACSIAALLLFSFST